MGAGGPVGAGGAVAPAGPGCNPGSLDELLDCLTEYKDEDGRWVLTGGMVVQGVAVILSLIHI